MIICLPASVRGPVDKPPCNLHRPFAGLSLVLSQTGGAWQWVFFLVLDPQAPLFFRGNLGSLAQIEIQTLKYLSRYIATICSSLLKRTLYLIPHDARVLGPVKITDITLSQLQTRICLGVINIKMNELVDGYSIPQDACAQYWSENYLNFEQY